MSFVFILAQAAAAASPDAVASQQQGVISYPPAFFAAFQPATASEMVARVPGFTLDTGSSVRGFEGAAGNVLIDGERPASKTDTLDNILRRLPASRIERIDLIRGGAPGIDMQGKTVLLNIIRKPGGGFRGLAALANQAFVDDGRQGLSARLEASGDVGQQRWELGFLGGKGFDGGFGDGTGVRITPAGVATPVDVDAEGDILNGQLTGVYETPVLGGKVRLNGRLYQDKYKGEETDTLLSAAPSAEHNVDVLRTEETEIGGTFTRKFGTKTTLDVTGLRQTRDREVASDFTGGSTSSFDNERDTRETIGRVVLKYAARPRLSLEAGAETAINKLDSATTLQVNGAPVFLPAANVRVEEDRSEAFSKATWRPADAWTVDGSLRYETSDISSKGDVVLSKTLNYLKPRLAVTWQPQPSTQVRVRLEREVGQLNFSDFVASANLNSASGVISGNPDIEPQQAWVAEIALERRFWGSGSATLTYAHQELSDVVDQQPVFDANGVFISDQPGNIGDGTRDTLSLDFSLPLDRIGVPKGLLRGTVTKRWSSVTDPTTGTSREISNLRPIEWNATYTQDLPQWKVSYGVDAFSAFRETSYRFRLTNTTKLRTFVKPYVEWRPTSDLNLRLELPNITERGLRRTVVSYAGPRGSASAGNPSIDDRTYEPGRMVYVRLRKTFGG